MQLLEMIDLLNADLAREYSHWHFYVHAARMVETIHRAELKEFFDNEAADELSHVQQWGDLIVGLGGVPTTSVAEFKNDLTDPVALLKETVKMESAVVANFVQRQDECAELEKNGDNDRVDGRRIDIFLDDQILDSRGTVDDVTKMLMGLDKASRGRS
jgi:bacterioferritin